MFELVTTVLCLTAIVVAFWTPVVSWCILALPLAGFFFMLFALYAERSEQLQYVPELSPKANEMLRKFSHYYSRPFGGRSVSASASAIHLSSIAVVIIGCIKGFWWGIAVCVVVWGLAGFIARQFNPVNFLLDDDERMAHDEVASWIRRRNSGEKGAV